MAHGDARDRKWRGKMRMEWVASSLALYVGTRSIQSLSAVPHSSTASSRLNWHPRRFKWTRPFRWKTKSGFCACAITFRTCYTNVTCYRVYSYWSLVLSCFPFPKFWSLQLCLYKFFRFFLSPSLLRSEFSAVCFSYIFTIGFRRRRPVWNKTAIVCARYLVVL